MPSAPLILRRRAAPSRTAIHRRGPNNSPTLARCHTGESRYPRKRWIPAFARMRLAECAALFRPTLATPYSRSEFLDPGPQLDLPGPGTARLAQDFEIGLGDPVGIERAVRPVVRIRAPRAAHPAVDHEMGDMDALGPEFSRRALRQTAQGELAHREGRREREPLDAGAGAGQEDRAMPVRDHAPRRLLGDEEPAKGRYLDRFADALGFDLADRAVRAGAAIVEHDVGLPEPAIRLHEQA